MKTTLEEINPVQKRILVTMPADKVNEAFHTAYSKLRKKARIQGFRPGKAPLSIIKKVYGDSISFEVGESLVNDNLFHAIQEHGVNPISKPHLESIDKPEQDKEYQFSAVVDIMPTLELGESHKDLKVSTKVCELMESDFEKQLEVLRKEASEQVEVEPEQVAQADMIAFLTREAKDSEGNELKLLSHPDTSIFLSDKASEDTFLKPVLGMKKGESKEADLVIPADHPAEEYRNQTISFTFTLNNLKKLLIPELNDEFAKAKSYESLADLKDQLRAHLENEVQMRNRRDLENAIMQELYTKLNFDVPPAIVDRVIDSMIEEANIPQEQKKDLFHNSKVRENLKPEALKKAKNTLLLWEVIKTEKLAIEEEELSKHFEEFFKSQGTENNDPATIPDDVKEKVKESMLFDKAMKTLVDMSSITEIPSSAFPA